MALTPQQKAQVDALLAQQKQKTQAPSSITPAQKAQVDALLAQQGVARPQPSPVQQPKKNNLLTSLAKPFLKVGTAAVASGEAIGSLAGAGIAAIGGDKERAQEGINKAYSSLSRERDYGALGSSRAIGVNQQTGEKQKFGELAKDVAGTALEIGSYAAPGAVGVGSKVLKPGQVAAKMTLNKAAPTIRSLIKGGALAGGSGALGSGLQEDQSFGKTVAQTAGGALLGGVTGGALPVLGAGVRKGVNFAGRIGGEILGRTTGAGEAAIREAFNNPNVVKFARQAGKEGPEGLMTQALDDAQVGLKQLKRARGNTYVKDLKKIKMNKTQLDGIIYDARTVARNLLDSSGVGIKEGKLLNTLDFADSTIERGQGTVQKAFNDVMRWTDVTPAGLDKLQKKLSQHLDEIPATERGGAFKFVLELKNAVTNRLKTDVKGYEQMTAKYHEASDLIDEIQRALSLKETAAKDTAIRKLMSSMRQNNELRNEMLGILGKTSGKDILGKIAGATLSPGTPRGLIGSLAPTATSIGGVSAILNPSTIPFFLLYLSSSSPRLVAEAVSLLGQVKGQVIPPKIQKALRSLLIQAIREAPNEID